MTDFVVIGGGIAGVSAAAHLAPHGSVVLCETEAALAWHTTGRSAAMLVLNYGEDGIRPLSRASQPFLDHPPEGSVDGPLLSRRGLLWVADPSQVDRLQRTAEEGAASGAGSEMVSSRGAVQLAPMLRPEAVAAGLWEPSARDIDVAGLHQAFVRMARAQGAEVRTTSAVSSIQRSGAGWSVRADDSDISCAVVVNAAGAWGDEVAAMAGVEAVRLQPMRRTAFMVPSSEGYASWPMVVDTDQRFYFKPDGVQILCSLAEEEPSPPCDPKPRMEDVALAIERINTATTLGIRTVNSQWTGLRTFAPDRELVVGEEASAPGFFWLVGQGGTGIQTSPAYGQLLASLVTGESLPSHLVDAGVDPTVYDPGRFR